MNTEPMQPADFLPFVNRNIANIHRSLQERSGDIAGQYPNKRTTPAERAEREPKILSTLWRGRLMSGFFAEHYAVGSVIDYHGVEAMVESTSWEIMGLSRSWEVRACMRSANGGIEHLGIPEHLAMALVWRKYSLPTNPLTPVLPHD